jgi:hypothetical protein
MNLAQTTQCPPAFWLEAACAGEAPPPHVTAHVATCERCTQRMQDLQQASEAFQAAHPPGAFRRRVYARLPAPEPRRSLRWLFALAPVAVSVGVLGAVLVRPPPEIRLKGSSFQVFYKRHGDPQPLLSGNHLRAGDALRFSYAAAADGYLMIVDVDGSGRVQALYPYGERDAAPVHAKDAPLLPGSIALDGTPGPERLFAVYRSTQFSLDSIARELQLAGASTPRLQCPDCRVDALRIEKEP